MLPQPLVRRGMAQLANKDLVHLNARAVRFAAVVAVRVLQGLGTVSNRPRIIVINSSAVVRVERKRRLLCSNIQRMIVIVACQLGRRRCKVGAAGL